MYTGYYDYAWDALPKQIPYDSFLQVISVITHLILPIPMHFAKRNEEDRDLEQRKVVKDNDEYLAKNNKHLLDLLFTYYVLFVLFTAYIDLVFLNR